MPVFDDARRAEAREIIARFPQGGERSALVPLLYLVQSIDGHVSREGMREIADLLGITTAEVESVATFYTMLRMHETGRHVVSVCTNVACALVGGNEVYHACVDEAGPGAEEISEDGLLTVHQEECLGVCDFAPVVQLNSANHDRVTPDAARTLIRAVREGLVPEAARGSIAPTSFCEASRILAGLEPLDPDPDPEPDPQEVRA
ncbi:MAG: NAD(P)H-dependent oxidoreductase subunit E [Actinomycetota bacterium]